MCFVKTHVKMWKKKELLRYNVKFNSDFRRCELWILESEDESDN